MAAAPSSIDEVEARLRERRYIGDRGLATSIFLALKLEKPLFIEGEAGVGKTEAAKALAQATASRLIRLQCYEGLDVAHAVYEWNYSRQLLHIRAAQEGTVSEQELFGPDFLIRRPLLEAIETEFFIIRVGHFRDPIRQHQKHVAWSVGDTLARIAPAGHQA